MAELLFVYGTLHPERAPAEIAEVAGRLVRVGPATIRGRRYELGSYPGVVPGGGGVVSGELFWVPDEAALAALDAYEEYLPELPEASLFVRAETEALLADGEWVRCWVYVYNRALPVTW